MKKLLSSRPALWFLFLFNLSVAAVAPFAIEGSQGVMTAVGMGDVSVLRSDADRKTVHSVEAGKDRMCSA